MVMQFDEDLSLDESCRLVMDAMKDYAKADIAMINSGLVVEPLLRTLLKIPCTIRFRIKCD